MDMELQLRGTGLLRTTRNYAERRFRFALRRLSYRIKRLRVCIEDLNGPRGGVDKRCRIVAEAVPFGNLVIEETDTHVREALDRAADRLMRNLRRELKRQQVWRQGKVKVGSIRFPDRWEMAGGKSWP